MWRLPREEMYKEFVKKKELQCQDEKKTEKKKKKFITLPSSES